MSDRVKITYNEKRLITKYNGQLDKLQKKDPAVIGGTTLEKLQYELNYITTIRSARRDLDHCPQAIEQIDADIPSTDKVNKLYKAARKKVTEAIAAKQIPGFGGTTLDRSRHEERHDDAVSLGSGVIIKQLKSLTSIRAGETEPSDPDKKLFLLHRSDDGWRVINGSGVEDRLVKALKVVDNRVAGDVVTHLHTVVDRLNVIDLKRPVGVELVEGGKWVIDLRTAKTVADAIQPEADYANYRLIQPTIFDFGTKDDLLADCPDGDQCRWKVFCDELLSDPGQSEPPPGMLDYFYNLLGNGMIGNPHGWFIAIYGPKRTGKTSLLKALKSVLGKTMMATIPPSAFGVRESKNADAKRVVEHARFGEIGEVTTAKLDEGEIKNLCDPGIEFPIRVNYRDTYNVVINFTPVFYGNNLPHVASLAGIDDRGKLVICNNRPPVKDPDLNNKLLDHRGCFLKKIIKHALIVRDWQDGSSLVMPPKVATATQQYAEDISPYRGAILAYLSPGHARTISEIVNKLSITVGGTGNDRVTRQKIAPVCKRMADEGLLERGENDTGVITYKIVKKLNDNPNQTG